MVASLLFLMPLLGAPEIPLRPGTPIVLDGRVETAEWQDAFSAGADLSDGKRFEFRMKRNGPWLAIGLRADRPYRGEVMRLYGAVETRPWISALFFGIGQPALPPLLWRRGVPIALRDAKLAPECPRACRARVRVGDPAGWSAEFLVRLSAIGAGRRDLRKFRIMAIVGRDQTAELLFALPKRPKDPLDAAEYADLVVEDNWGENETWPPVSTEVSREFDDHELLYRLYLEHDRISLREAADRLIISSAVQPRSLTRITSLRGELEAGRARNPTLPAWRYYLGRLLHESNFFAEARELIDGIPEPLRPLDAFVNLAGEHFLDTQEWQRALAICKERPEARGSREVIAMATQGEQLATEEAKAVVADGAKPEKNPRVKLHTAKGAIVVELFEDDAPHAVRNFIDLVSKRNYYDKMRFHRVQGGQHAIVGDPTTRPGVVADARNPDGPGWLVRPDETKRPLLRGYLTLLPAPGGVFHGSQFALSVAPLVRTSQPLNVFGRIVEGLEVLDAIEQDDRLDRIEILRQRNHGYDPLAARLK